MSKPIPEYSVGVGSISAAQVGLSPSAIRDSSIASLPRERQFVAVADFHAGGASSLQSDKRVDENLNTLRIATISAFIMIKFTVTVLAAAAMLAASSAFAGDHACCAKGAANASSMACVNLASLNLVPDQKTKIEAWQAECMKAGCTKKSRQTFLSRAKGILSPEQFAQLKAQCAKIKNSEA